MVEARGQWRTILSIIPDYIIIFFLKDPWRIMKAQYSLRLPS